MRQRVEPHKGIGHETLVCFAWLRQKEAACPVLRAAYGRLIEAASRPGGAEVATVLLDWLETELAVIGALGEEAGRRVAQLMRAAVALLTALKP